MVNPGQNVLLKKARQANGWTQKELAEHLGVITITVGRWERGDAAPTRQNIAVLSQIFRMTPQQLGFLSEAPPRESPSDEHFSIFDPMIPPPSRIPLIGRDEMLSKIKMQFLVKDTTPTQVAFNGLPGTGKTALAISLTYDPAIREHFSDGILWAGMGPTANNVEGILSRWCRLFRVDTNSLGASNQREIWARTLRDLIGQRQFLIVLDDAWNLDDALALKVGGERCAYVLTTRRPALAAAFAQEAAIQIAELDEEESLDLLQHLAPEITNTSIETRCLLVHATGMLPLALTLAGKYVHTQAYQRPQRRLQVAIERLLNASERVRLSQPIALVERHPSLPDSSLSLYRLIAVSDEHLDPLTQAALRALSVFPPKPNTFSEEAAIAVAACTIETLDILTDAGLLESNEVDRYTLHQTIADYARTNQIDALATERLVSYITPFVEAYTTDNEILEQDRDNVLTALDLAHGTEKQEDLARIACAFAPFLLSHGLYDQAKIHLQRAYEVTGARGDNQNRTRVLDHLGMIAQKQGEYQQATAYYQEGLVLARNIGILEQICELLSNLGWVTAKRGLYAEAQAYAQEGLDMLDQINDHDHRCKLLTILGVVADNRGEFIQAEKYYREGLILALQNNDKEQQCIILNDLGVNASEQGLWKEAFQFYQEVRQLAIQMKHLEWHCLALLNLSTYYIVQEDYASASQYNEEALHFTRQLGQREWECFALIIQGALALRGKKNYDQAKVLLQEGLALAAEIEKPHYVCDALKFLGDLALECQRIEEAATFYAQMGQFIPSGHKGLNAENLYRLGLVAAARQETQEAKNLGKAAFAIFQEIGHRSKDEVRQWVAMDCPPSLPISI